MNFDFEEVSHQAPAGEVNKVSPRSSTPLQPVTIADQNITILTVGDHQDEETTPQTKACVVGHLTLSSLIESEAADRAGLDEDDDLDDEPSPANISHGEQYLITPSGLPTICEYLATAGLVANSAAKNTPGVLPIYNHSGVVEDTTHLVKGGRRKMVEVTTRTGGKLVTTINHRVLAMEGAWWVALRVGEIKPGDCIMMQRFFEGEIGTPSDYSTGALALLGVIVADAHLHPLRVLISNDDPDIQSLIIDYGPELFGFGPLTYKKEGNTGSIAYHFNSKKRVGELYAKLGWKPCKAAGKEFGPMIRALDTEGIRAFLQGYVDCESTIDDKGCIVVSSASWRLLFEVKLALLAHFGIIGLLHYKHVANYAENDYWTLTLSGGEAVSYVEKVGFISQIRQKQADQWEEKVRNPNLDVIPGLGTLLTAIHGGSETTREHVSLVRDYKGDKPRADVTYQRLKRILDASWAASPALDRLRQVHEGGYFYDEVISVAPIGAEPAFDFDMPHTHGYLLNGFATRNSADRVACSMGLAA